MNYQLTVKKVISSQYLFTGLRITAAAVIPALILYHYNVLALMSAIPLGALIVGSIDSPGPFEHRRNTILASILINLFVIVITISLNHNPAFIIAGLIIFGMFFSLIGIYGNRVNSIGLVALLVFIFNIDSKASFGSPWFNGLLFTAGGMFYFLISLALHRLRPYRYIQLQLGENVRTIARFTETLAGLFKVNHDNDYLFNRLHQQQINIQQQQDILREMLLSTRQMVIDSTAKGRIIMMMFLDSIDLFERLLSLQQDYTDVYEHVNSPHIASAIEETLRNMQQELNAIGYAFQFNHPSHQNIDVNEATQKLLNIFLEERKKSLNKNTLPYFIKLRQIVYALQDVGERINRLHRFSHYDKMTTRQYKRAANEELQMQSTEISPALFVENLTFKSSQFKHALRVTIALLIGYCVSLFFPLGHGYWILLTIAVILKPAYSISRTRNKQRLLGTITGVIAGFIFLYFVKNATLTFLLMLCAMIIAYSLLKLNYYISCVCITIYVLLSFHFLNNSNFTVVVTDRLIDTAIGCVIAFAASLIVFPVWEHEQMKELISKLIEANRKYFNAAAALIESKEENDLYKPARREAFVALANLNDSFQRILSEKRKRNDTAFYHQMASSSYMMTAHIASLSSLISRNKNHLNDTDFEPLINNVNDKFKRSEQTLKGESLKTITSNRNAPITNKIQRLLEQRQKEIDSGIIDKQTSARKMLASIKTVTDELQVIDSIAGDEVKILQRLN